MRRSLILEGLFLLGRCGRRLSALRRLALGRLLDHEARDEVAHGAEVAPLYHLSDGLSQLLYVPRPEADADALGPAGGLSLALLRLALDLGIRRRGLCLDPADLSAAINELLDYSPYILNHMGRQAYAHPELRLLG